MTGECTECTATSSTAASNQNPVRMTSAEYYRSSYIDRPSCSLFFILLFPPIHPHPLSTTHPQHPTDPANQRQGQFKYYTLSVSVCLCAVVGLVAISSSWQPSFLLLNPCIDPLPLQLICDKGCICKDLSFENLRKPLRNSLIILFLLR